MPTSTPTKMQRCQLHQEDGDTMPAFQSPRQNHRTCRAVEGPCVAGDADDREGCCTPAMARGTALQMASMPSHCWREKRPRGVVVTPLQRCSAPPLVLRPPLHRRREAADRPHWRIAPLRCREGNMARAGDRVSGKSMVAMMLSPPQLPEQAREREKTTGTGQCRRQSDPKT